MRNDVFLEMLLENGVEMIFTGLKDWQHRLVWVRSFLGYR